MKIALASFEFRNRDIDHNLEQIFFGMGKAEMFECDVVLFSEAFLQGFDACHWNYAEDEAIGLTLDSPPIQKIQAYAADMDIAVGFGFIEKYQDKLFSSYAFVAKNGEIIDVFHRNSIGWKEFVKTDQHYKEGQGFKTFDYLGQKFITALGGDLWDESHIQALQSMEKNWVIWPCYLPFSKTQWAKEKSRFIALAQQCGAPTFFINSHSHKPVSLGGAFVFDQGKTVSSLELGNKGILIYETK